MTTIPRITTSTGHPNATPARTTAAISRTRRSPPVSYTGGSGADGEPLGGSGRRSVSVIQ
jgi:hypothetical protein